MFPAFGPALTEIENSTTYTYIIILITTLYFAPVSIVGFLTITVCKIRRWVLFNCLMVNVFVLLNLWGFVNYYVYFVFLCWNEYMRVNVIYVCVRCCLLVCCCCFTGWVLYLYWYCVWLLVILFKWSLLSFLS